MTDRSPNPILRQIHALATGADGRTDAHLLHQFVSRCDEAAFAALVERHGPMVLGVCRRVLPDFHAAEDVFQAVFLVLARKAGTIRKQESLGSWLHGVALRLANKAKAQAVRAARSDERPHSSTPDLLDDITLREVKQILDTELDRLPERYRLPLVLCYLEGRTRDEAAAQLGWSIQKIKGQLERGRERLRNRLVRRGVVLSAALSATLLADGATAAVPPPLESGVVSAAVQFASGRPASACGGSTLAAILAQGAVKSMTSTIWKIAAAFVLFAGAIGTVAFAIPGSEPPPKNAGPVSNNPPAQEPAPVRATFIEERGGKPPMRFYHVKLELTNPRDRPVWLLLGYYGDQPLNPDAKFATDSDGSPQTITGMFFDGDKNKGWGKVIELHAGGDKGFRAILLPPRATIRFDNYAISAWNAVNTIQVWEASDLAVNGKTPLQNWLPYAAMSDQKARIAPNTDGTNLDWDAKASKSRTDYLNEKITSIDAAVLKKWVVPIEGMPPAKPQPPAGAAPVGPAPSPPGIAIEWQHAFEAKLAGAGAGKVEFSPDGRLLASTAKFPGRPQMWNVASGEEVPLQKFGGRTSFLQFNRDGQPLGTSYLDGAERDPKTVLTGFDMWTHKDWFNVELRDEDGIRCYRHVALSPGGQTLALSDWPDKVSIYDLKTGEKQFDLPAGGGRAVQPVRFAPNAKSVAVAYAANDSGAKKSGHVVKLWAVDDLAPSNARPKWSVETLDPGIDLIFTPDGKRLVVGLQNSAHVLVLDSENGKERMQLGSNTDSKRHTFLAFSPDGRTVAANWKSGEESGVVLWDIETGKTQTILKEPKQPVFALAFSRDGTRLAAADMGNFLHVWTRK